MENVGVGLSAINEGEMNMAFTVKDEYERLNKYHSIKPMIYEQGCVNVPVSRFEYAKDFWGDDKLNVYVIDIFDNNTETLVMTITEEDVCKAYNKRRYKYWKKYNIIEAR